MRLSCYCCALSSLSTNTKYTCMVCKSCEGPGCSLRLNVFVCTHARVRLRVKKTSPPTCASAELSLPSSRTTCLSRAARPDSGLGSSGGMRCRIRAAGKESKIERSGAWCLGGTGRGAETAQGGASYVLFWHVEQVNNRP